MVTSSNWFVPEGIRAIASKGALFYPCAGTDVSEPVAAFAPDVRSFWFCDTGSNGPQALPGCASLGVEIRGLPDAAPSSRSSGGRSYKHVEPCVWSERLRHAQTGNEITVNWRRGYGQYALAREFADGSISVFMHRGDSPGESGSNAWFLGRKRRDHEPLSNLFDKLVPKLRSTALIVSDGSNCSIRPLRRFHGKATSAATSAEAFAEVKDQAFEHWGLRWSCVGYMGRRYGPTLVWRVERLTTA